MICQSCGQWDCGHEAEIERLRADLEDISDAFPDDATHKHEVTGESLVDNVRDALRDLAKAKADLAAARKEIARRAKQPAPSTLEPPFTVEFDRHWEKYSILDSSRSVICRWLCAVEAQWICDALNDAARAGGTR